ncbi:sigma factor G inhibitor Gin [Halalkalibacillus sediminis]|nr:sigma factor G inhibitor Gin [Halalkalibacillus sediminis]
MANKSMKQCNICEDVTSEGFYLFLTFICSKCEQEMVHTSPEEEKYQYFIDRLKSNRIQEMLM